MLNKSSINKKNKNYQQPQQFHLKDHFFPLNIIKRY
jgi:hypothetical protein